MFKKMLIDGAKAMGIEMSPGQAEKFEIYHNMLVEANARMNLTRVPEDLREAIDTLKGPSLDEELAEAAYALEVLGGAWERTEALAIPGRDWDHRCAWIRKVQPTPEKYPRKAGQPEKKPLIAK